jgi:tRNA modification GTPase
MTPSSIDTIAAIATAPGEAGIAIVRVSGADALLIADTLFRCSPPVPSARPPNSFVHGFVTTPGETTDIDEAILLIYRAPHSYTREDVVEFQGHGGPVPARRILRHVLGQGARPAQPGEFTRRAFLNGRIDLLQAEAVADLIRARSDRAAVSALEQLEGSLTTCITTVYDCILRTCADMEATLDFEDGELPAPVFPDIERRIAGASRDLSVLLSTSDEGRLLREGAVAVISGQPNVGKSTLLNSLVGTERAIVTDHPGTTRDTIEEAILIDGIPLRVVDTAGLRDSVCDVEREGIRRAEHHMEHADVNLHVLDGSHPIDTDERRRLNALDPARALVIANKTDRGCVVAADPALASFRVVLCSLIGGQGLGDVRSHLLDLLQIPGMTRSQACVAERHRAGLQEAALALDEALRCIRGGREDELVLASASLRRSLDALGTLTGRTYTDEILESVFSRFCVGK